MHLIDPAKKDAFAKNPKGHVQGLGAQRFSTTLKPLTDSEVRELNRKLYAGAMSGDLAAVHSALVDGAEVNASDSEGKTLLMSACQSNNPTLAKLLLENGANTTIVDEQSSRAALHFACAAGSEECVSLLVQNRLPSHELDRADADGNTGITLAATVQAESIVSKLLEFGANPNLQNVLGETALMRSIRFGGMDDMDKTLRTVSCLVSANADLEIQDASGMTALAAAVKVANNEVAALLLADGASVVAVDTSGTTILEHAVHGRCSSTVIRMLVANGAQLPARERFAELIIGAIDIGDVDFVKLLLGGGFNPNSVDKLGNAPLVYAIKKGMDEASMLLLSCAAQILYEQPDGVNALIQAAETGSSNIVDAVLGSVLPGDLATVMGKTCKKGQTPLMHAAVSSNAYAVQKFVQNSGYVTGLRDHAGKTALLLAIQSGSYESVTALLDNSADEIMYHDSQTGAAPSKSNFVGPTPLMAVFRTTVRDSVGRVATAALIHRLTIWPGDRLIDETDSLGCNIIMSACLSGNVDAVQLAIDLGKKHKVAFDLNPRDSRGWTTMHYAAAANAVDVIGLLSKGGVQFDAQSRTKSTPLMVAAERGHVETVELLLKHGANPYVKDSEGHTPVMCALWNPADANLQKHLSSASVLLAAGADIHFKTRFLGFGPISERSILDRAIYLGKSEVILFLLNNGAVVTPSQFNRAIKNANISSTVLAEMVRRTVGI